jgi:cobalt-zinc-cadmium efflux system protein
MSDHDHAHGASTPKLKLALAATAIVAVVEVIGGLRSGSLALLSDAAHVSMDVVALGIALAAAVGAKRPATHRQTYGFARYEILAALANGGLLTAVTVLIVIEAIRRLMEPVTPVGSLMAAVATFGLIVNVGIGVMLVRGVHGNLNMRAAILHVCGDALGAIAVIVGGILIAATGIGRIDPILSLIVAAIILAGVVGIVREATDVLLESAPGHAEVPAVRTRIRVVQGVVDVHDLHVWTIGSGHHALSAHVVLDDRKLSEASSILRTIVDAVRADFDITHATVQFECESCEADTTIICTPSGGSRSAPARESERGLAKSATL